METIAFLFVLVGLTHCGPLTSSLSLIEQHKLLQGLYEPPRDLESAYFCVKSIEAIGRTHNEKEFLCNFAEENLDVKNIESWFQYSEVVKTLGCKKTKKLSAADVLGDDATAIQYSHAVAAMSNLGNTVDVATLKKFVDLAKENDTPVSAAAAFYTASLLSKSDTLKPIVSMVEDIVAQADEISGEILQFEGGLSVTAAVVSGIMRFSDKQGDKLMKDDQVTKFAKYFVNRKFVNSFKDIFHLTSALAALANNKVQVPVVVSVFKSSFITKENPLLKVRVTNVLDKSIEDVTVAAKEFITADESVTLFDNKPFVKSNNKNDVITIENEVAKGHVNAHAYDLNVMSAKPKPGMFNCKVVVSFKGSKHFVKENMYGLKVKVLAHVMVEDVDVAVGEKDQALGKPVKLSYPNTLGDILEADTHQKIVMNFNLKDANSGEKVTAHQTFIRLINKKTQQEIFFVAEPDTNNHYTFTLDVSATAKDSFNHQSGTYKMALIVGDATMQLPISWSMGEINLKFTGKPVKTKRQERNTKPQPVIDHMFRVPEKRPPQMVSAIFTALVLSPLLLMFILWLKIGANLSNFSFSLSTLVFHIGLAGIFSLYYMFWIKLNMFQTLKLLAVIGGVTFLGGNKMLADIASEKYKA